MRKRLEAMIDEDNFNYIKDESERSGIPMNVIADDLIAKGLAIKRGEIIEQQSLPIIRNIVQTELRKANAQLRTDLQEDMQLELTNEIKSLFRASDNRIAAFLVKIFRHANIAQRLAYATLAKTSNPDFAMRAFEDASAKAVRDLKAREES